MPELFTRAVARVVPLISVVDVPCPNGVYSDAFVCARLHWRVYWPVLGSSVAVRTGGALGSAYIPLLNSGLVKKLSWMCISPYGSYWHQVSHFGYFLVQFQLYCEMHSA